MDVAEIQEVSGEEEMEQTMSILMLNEYCLLEIFSYLKIDEVFRMEEVCTRFEEISQRIYLSTRSLDINELYKSNVTIPDIMRILSRVGQYIYTLIAEEYTIKLKKGEIPLFLPGYSSVLNPVVEPVLKQIQHEGDEIFAFRSLKEANIPLCAVTDEELSYLLPLNQLEALNVSNSHGHKGRFLKNLKNIIELDLYGVSGINSEIFKEFCEATPNLRSLNLGWTRIYPEDLEAISQNLQNLERLAFSNYYYALSQEDFRDLADLPKLKHLELYQLITELEVEEDEYDNLIDLSEFLLLVSHHNRLESLEYECFPQEVDSSTFSTINRALAKLTNLKNLWIYFSNTVTDWYFADNMLEQFTYKHNLEELKMCTLMITSKGLEMFIKRCPTIRFIDISRCYKLLEFDFLNNIRDCLSKRNHVLQITVAKEMQKQCEDLINGKEFTNLKLVFKSF